MNNKINLVFFFLGCIFFLGCSENDSEADSPEQNLTEQEIEAICENTWNKVSAIIGDNYLNAKTPSDLAFLFDDIKKLEYVEEVSYNDNNMFIVLKNGNVWGWLFNNYKADPYDDFIEENCDNTETRSINEANLPTKFTRASSTPHLIKKTENEKIKILIFNQTSKDESRQDEKLTWLNLKQYLENNGFDVTLKEENYGLNDIHNYDIAILHTHGFYIPEILDEDGNYIFFGQHYLFTSQLVNDNFSVCRETLTETRNGKKCEISYKIIPEDNVKSLYSGKFKEKETFIFCTACEALKDGTELADAFNHCGASGFVGYTDESSVGMAAANSFMKSLSMDYTIQEAIDRIPDRYKHQTSYKDDETGKITKLDARLKVIYKSSINKNLCYAHTCPDDIHPHLIDMGDGVKWSCCNIGASSPYSIGNYYSWGETSTKHAYSYNDNYEMQHNVRFPSNIAATNHDAAWVNTSQTLRMPLVSEFRTLLKNSNITWWIKENQGACLISKINGNRLFIPAGGWIFEGEHMGRNQTGILWSAERSPWPEFSSFMQVMNNDGNIGGQIAESRYSGHNVRGVAP